MSDREVLSRVADGLVQVAKSHGMFGVYREDLKFFEWICHQNEGLIPFLNSPSVDLKDKYKALDNIFGELLVPEVLAFIKILVRDHIIDSFPQIRQEYNRLADEDANLAEGELYTPFALDQAVVHRLERAFSHRLGRRVILTQIPEPGLLAGIRVVLLGREYEYSIDTLIENAKRAALKKEKEGGQDGR